MRNAGLDILRFIAVFLVLGRHLHLPIEANILLKHWQVGGWIGVDLFFVLSGFLISGLLFKEYQKTGSVNIKTFLIRRGFKIYPPFYFLLIATILILIYSGSKLEISRILPEIFFLQNYFKGLQSHTWSLAVEEQFYILIAIAFFVVLNNKPKGDSNPFSVVPLLFLATFILCSSFRILNYFYNEHYSHSAFLFPLHLRADSLMFGVFISYYWHFHNLKEKALLIKTPYLIIVAFGFFVPAFLFPLEKYFVISVIWVVFLYIASGLLILAALRLERTKSKILTLIISLGAASYSIYLWHIPVATWGWNFVKKINGFDHFEFFLAFYFVGSFLIGWILYKTIELPMLKIRDMLVPSGAVSMRR